MQGIIEQAFPFFKFQTVDLKGGESAIDDKLTGLIITQPQRNYTERELRRVDGFLMRGGKSLVVYASAVTLKPGDRSMHATLSLHGLDRLLSGYGIQMNKDAVIDHVARMRLSVPTSESIIDVRHPGIPHLISGKDRQLGWIDDSFTPFFRMDELILPFASSLELHPEAQPSDVKLRGVAYTSESSGIVTTATIDMGLHEWIPKRPLQARLVAAVVTGKLRTAFPPSATEPGPTAPTESRLLVISSSELLTNPFAYATNGAKPPSSIAAIAPAVTPVTPVTPESLAQPYTRYPTSVILSLKNTLDWLTGDEDLIELSEKFVSPPH